MTPESLHHGRAAAFVSLCSLALLFPLAAGGETGTTACFDGDPAGPIEQFRTISGQGTFEMWPATLQPVDPQGQPLPIERDSTLYNGFQRPGQNSGDVDLDGENDGLEFFYDLDIEESAGGTYLYMAYNAGFQIWDIQGAAAANPVLLSQRDGWMGDFHDFQNPVTEIYFLIFGIDGIDPPDAPGDTLIALSGLGPVGPTIWDASDKTDPTQLYQDEGKTGVQVAAANIGNRSYAFFTSGDGVHVYDMTRAREVGPCFENTNIASTLCGGSGNPVWRGRLGPWPWGRAEYLDVLETEISGQTKHFIAVSDAFFFNDLGVEIREITDATSLPPTSASVIEGLHTLSFGVDLFEYGGRHYLGAVSFTDLEIHDVTACLASAAGCSLATPEFAVTTATDGDFPSLSFVQYSEAGGTPFLYKGFSAACSTPPAVGGPDQELLLDLSGLATGGAIVEVVGDEYMDPNQTNPQQRINYWSSYYDKSTDGYSAFSPHAGKFHGNYFYRASQSMFDVHEYLGESVRPSGPAVGFRDEAVTFSATVSGCTPGPTYSWSATGGGQVTGTGATVEITWATTGPQTVTVSNSGCPEAGPGSADIDIQAPEAMVGSVSATPAAPVVCEQVSFASQNVTGKTPITYDWEVRDAGGVVASGSGTTLETFDWQTGAGTAAGSYTAEVSVSNTANPPPGDTANVAFVLSAPATLTVPQPTYDGSPADPASTTVQFRVQAPGATEWRWDWGDGSAPETFTSRAAGENPTHTFAVREAPYLVTVTVSNCLVPGGLASQALSVTVDQPLEVLQFRARCPFGVCDFRVGNPVIFDQQFSGEPTLYEYDWDANGSFETSASTPITTHTYNSTASDFNPRIRISRSVDSVSFTHQAALTVNAQAPPSVSVSGPTTRGVNQSGAFSASASNCTAASTGWTWTATGGGQISGSTTNQVSVTWSTAGAKTVTARNSACGSASGNRSVSVTESSATLNAAFDFLPATPLAGSTVAFDAAASTGSIVEYSWRFDDDNSREEGVTASHVFVDAGSYDVTLTVVSVPGCVTSACVDSVTQTVEVTDGDRKLVLPYFEVGTGETAGVTTLFAVRNGSDMEVSLKYEYFSSAGATLFMETVPLGPRATRTVTLSAIPELLEPGSDLATGYLHVSAQDPIPAPAFYGDFFRIDPVNNFASGGLLLSSPGVERAEECQFWDVRYLEGGEFDGGTQFTFHVPGNPQDDDPVVFGDVYDLAGNLVQTLSITEPGQAFEMNSADLELVESFGVIEWSFRDGLVGNISGIFKARGRFEVGLRGVCQDAP